jgi:hypothetical protein
MEVARIEGAAAGARRIRITLKLFASLIKYLPDTHRRSREMPMEIDPGMPAPLVKLVLLNGVFVPPDERASTRFADGDVLAIWPPVPGG